MAPADDDAPTSLAGTGDDAPMFLIGFMASGKTTIGRLLAERLDWTFVDLDKLIEDGAQRPVADIFVTEGEDGFRKRETEALRDVARRRKTVIATGGGAPCREENLETMLAAGRVFWLEVSADEAVTRAGKVSGRPLLDGAADPIATARKLMTARRPFYARAHARIDTDGRSAEEIVNGLLRASLMMTVGQEMLER
jgi:shikimate kinase